MEIYRQRVNKVWFEAPSIDTSVTATVSLNGGVDIPVEVLPREVPTNTNRWINLPYINTEGTLVVKWSFAAQTFMDTVIASDSVTHKDTYDIVTPILTRSEIKSIHPQATDDEIVRVERAVRHIINAHTGQRFGLFHGVKKVAGSASNALFLPERLLELTSVNGGNPINYVIDADGYILRYYPWGVPPVKADFYGLHMHTGGVIHNPNGVHLGEWSKSKTYDIDGSWGWEEIPSQVVEAAKLLVNDYACADNAYRDRYLTSMTAADWRIQFNSGAFAKTGNVRADQLLSDFVLKRGWAVI